MPLDEDVGAGVMYRTSDGRVLLLQRAEGHDEPGTWAFPGGHIEPGEKPIDAARRESLEEIGYHPGELELHAYIDGYTTFTAPMEEFEPILNDEHTAAIWAPLHALPAPLHPGVAKMLQATAMDERQFDVNGFMTVPRNPISRSGVFPYRGSQIPGAPDPGAIYYVYRPPEELADPEAIESFKLLPIVDDHTMLGDGFTPAEAKGVHGTTGDDVQFADGVLSSTLRVFSQSMREKIERREKIDLSLGYRCVYEASPGNIGGREYQYVQRRLRGNHLALVGEARCDVYVMDGMAFDAMDLDINQTEATNMADAEKTGDGGNPSGDMTIGQLADIVKAIVPQIATLNEIVAKLGVAHAEPDGDEPVAGVADKDPAPAMDEAAIAKRVMQDMRQRDKLVADLSPIVGVFDHADMTVDEVAKYGVQKLGIACDAGFERGALSAYLAGRAAAPARQVESHAQDSAPVGALAAYLGRKE